MGNFYLKIKKFSNEIEFSTDDENMFNVKIQELLKDFSNIEISNHPEQTENIQEEQPFGQENNRNQEQAQTPQLCDFVEIVEPKISVNQMQNDEPQQNDLTADFEQILDKAKETPTIQFSEPENNNAEFCAFVTSQNPQNDLDYLIFTAQYFNRYLNKQNFTLKQINSKLVPAKNIAISHKVLQEAVEQGWIAPVLDLTETTVNKEYCLTQGGEHEYRHN